MENFAYKKEEIEKVAYFCFEENNSNSYLLTFQGNIEGVTLDKNLSPNKLDFKLIAKVGLFTIDSNKNIINTRSGKISVNLKEVTQIQLFDQIKFDQDNLLNDVYSDLSLNEDDFGLTFYKDNFEINYLETKNKDNFNYSIGFFQIDDEYVYLFPSVIKLSEIEDSIKELSIHLSVEDKAWETFRFLVVQEEKSFWPKSYNLENGFKIVPEFSSESNSELKIKLLNTNNKEIISNKNFFFGKDMNERINIEKDMDGPLMVKELIETLQEKERILNLVTETKKFLIEIMRSAISDTEGLEVITEEFETMEKELESITGLKPTEEIMRLYTESITTVFN